MPVPSWVAERKPTLSGTVLMYWTVLVFRDGAWRVHVCITDGERNKHTAQYARHVIEYTYGKAARAAVCGPYYDSVQAHQIETKIYEDDSFAVALAESAF